MARFTAVVRSANKDGLTAVYIRITHNRGISYLRTDKLVHTRMVNRHGEITDRKVSRHCDDLMEKFAEFLNEVNYGDWKASEIRDFLLLRLEGRVTFTGFCRDFIRRKRLASEGNAHVYEASLASLSRFLGSEEVRFSDMTASILEDWIDSLKDRTRARSLYPKRVKVMYEAAERASHDARNGLRQLNDIWNGVLIPRYVSARKLAVTADACRRFFNFDAEVLNRSYELMELGRDVAMLSFCLGGMNTVDLFELKKSDFFDGIIHYKRRKTSSRRSDGAYFEMRVPDILEKVLERWRSWDGSEYLFSFAEKYRTPKIFNVSVNNGIKQICRRLGVGKLYSAYTFRHTWATLAQNEIGASLAEIGFGMNHAINSVTRGYIRIDFSPAWRLNESIVKLVFGYDGEGGDKASGSDYNRGAGHAGGRSVITPESMIYARAYFQGKVVAEVSDIGFSNVEEVIARLAPQLPPTIPEGCAVQFRIKDVDAEREAVYERTKGKGF